MARSNYIAGWHHWLDGRESEWTLGIGEGQEGLACCDSWGRKESDMTEPLNWTELNWTELYWTRGRKSGQNTSCASRKMVLEPTALHISDESVISAPEDFSKGPRCPGWHIFIDLSLLGGGRTKTLSESEMILSVPGHHKLLANWNGKED